MTEKELFNKKKQCNKNAEKLVELEAEIIGQQTSWFLVLYNLVKRTRFSKDDTRRTAALRALLLKFLPSPGGAAIFSGGIISLIFLILQTQFLFEQNKIITKLDTNSQRLEYAKQFYDETKFNESIKNLSLNGYLNTYEPLALSCDNKSYVSLLEFLGFNYISESCKPLVSFIAKMPNGKIKFNEFDNRRVSMDLTIHSESYKEVEIYRQNLVSARFAINSDRIDFVDTKFSNSSSKFSASNLYMGYDRCQINESNIQISLKPRKNGKSSKARLYCSLNKSALRFSGSWTNRPPKASLYFGEIKDSEILFDGSNYNKDVEVPKDFYSSKFNVKKFWMGSLSVWSDLKIYDSLITVSGNFAYVGAYMENTKIHFKSLRGEYNPVLTISEGVLYGIYSSDVPVFINIGKGVKLDLSKADITDLKIANPEVLSLY